MRPVPAVKGVSMARCAITAANSLGNPILGAEFARKHYAHDPSVEACFKAAVAAGTTADASFASALVSYGIAEDFLQAARAATVLDRIPGTRRGTFQTDYPRETSAASAGWVGQGAPRPITRATFDTLRLERFIASVLIVLNAELWGNLRPGSEAAVLAMLVAAIAQHLDQQFLDPEVAAVAGISPASITNAATRITPTGATAATAQADIPELFEAVTTSLSEPVIVMTPRTCAQLASWGFEGVKINGGTLCGVPIVCSASARPIGSPSANLIVLLDAAELIVADEGSAAVEASGETSLQMLDNPTNDAATATATTMVSMWQTNSIAIRVQREIAWAMAHSGACAFMEVSY